jgi:hypothetical protein
MNTLHIQNPQREFVWVINPPKEKEQTTVAPPQAKRETEDSKSPTHIQELVEKTFRELSLTLLDRIADLEQNILMLKNENLELRKTLNHISVAYEDTGNGIK